MSTRMGKKLAILASLAAVTVFIGHGCSNFTAGSGGDMSSSGGGPVITNGGDTGEVGGVIQPMAGANTVSLIYNKQLLDNMVVCAGTGTASPETVAEWESRQSSFSEYGFALDVTAPMLMAITAVAGEICDDLLDVELAQAPADRRLFKAWDFSKAPSVADLPDSAINDAARRFALSCWARTEVAGEALAYREELRTSTESQTLAETRKLALIMCTGALASLSGITL